jgi:hypothetical protein
MERRAGTVAVKEPELDTTILWWREIGTLPLVDQPTTHELPEHARELSTPVITSQ